MVEIQVHIVYNHYNSQYFLTKFLNKVCTVCYEFLFISQGINRPTYSVLEEHS
jgi:hypothetical protein